MGSPASNTARLGANPRGLRFVFVYRIWLYGPKMRIRRAEIRRTTKETRITVALKH